MTTNILFITSHEITPQKGGIEKMTDIVSSQLSKEKQFKCFSAYFYPTTLEKTFFIDKICLLKTNTHEQLEEFIKKNEIDLIINQQIYSLHKTIKKLTKKHNLKYIFFQHDRPIVDIRASIIYYSFAAFHGTDMKKRTIMICKLLISPLYICLRKLYYCIMFRDIYSNVDSLVLLSNKFMPVLLRTMIKTKYNNSSISIINNCITLEDIATSYDIERKRKEVLIVSRLTEERKRISIAIKIWHQLQLKYNDIKDWNLRIVGSGEDENVYKKYVKKKRIPNIIFEGQVKDTISYYRQASIFMMTSDSEGWGLTLMEAQQMGTVPIAFDSYETITEIICDGINGVLVENNNKHAFVGKLHSLIKNETLRKQLAINGLNIKKRFSVEHMMRQWLDMLNKINK